MSKRVLIAVDGSDQAEAAFEHALGAHPDAQFALVHVVNPSGGLGYSDEGYFDVEGYAQSIERLREEGESLLARYSDVAEEEGHAVETILRTGKPVQEILDAVDETDADHVVIGSHGRSGVGRVLFGSVAETVTRRSPVPVTIVR